MLNAADIQHPRGLNLDKRPDPFLKDGVISRFYQIERKAEENRIAKESKKYAVDHPPAVRGRVITPKELENKGEGQDENGRDQVFTPLPGGLPYLLVIHFL